MLFYLCSGPHAPNYAPPLKNTLPSMLPTTLPPHSLTILYFPPTLPFLPPTYDPVPTLINNALLLSHAPLSFPCPCSFTCTTPPSPMLPYQAFVYFFYTTYCITCVSHALIHRFFIIFSTSVTLSSFCFLVILLSSSSCT